eukprot:9049086-Alexandrium_andersonii.AAC.1
MICRCILEHLAVQCLAWCAIQPSLLRFSRASLGPSALFSQVAPSGKQLSVSVVAVLLARVRFSASSRRTSRQS